MYCNYYVDDEVYIAAAELRNEYVLNDLGLVYAGWSPSRGPNPFRWNFGQVCHNISTGSSKL